MCGLLGFSGEFDFDPLKIKLLYLYNESRGTDSCGFYTEPMEGDSALVKKVGKASSLLTTTQFKPTNFLIGHTRKSTVGITNENNAHPFKYMNVVGAHNGGISNYYTMTSHREIPAGNYWVDSQALYRCMEYDGDFKPALEQYNGSAALLFTMFNRLTKEIGYEESHRLYCYRDKDKPLFHGRIKIDGKVGTYISSIKESLEAIECSRIREFPVEVVHIFEKGKLVERVKIKRSPMVIKTTVTEEVEETPYERRHGNYTTRVYPDKKSIKERVDSILASRKTANYSNYQNPNYCLYVGYDIRPNILGRSMIALFFRYIKKATVMYADHTSKTMTIKILELTDDAPKESYEANECIDEVKMEYFEQVWPLKELAAPKEKNDADVKISGMVPAVSVVEKELHCTDFDDVRDQYWATLIGVMEKCRKIREDGYWNVEQNIDELNEYIEEEIYLMFSMNV